MSWMYFIIISVVIFAIYYPLMNLLVLPKMKEREEGVEKKVVKKKTKRIGSIIEDDFITGLNTENSEEKLVESRNIESQVIEEKENLDVIEEETIITKKDNSENNSTFVIDKEIETSNQINEDEENAIKNIFKLK